MSTFFLADRIKELSRTETAGPIVLDGAVAGFSGFGDFYASGDVVFYAITDNVEYEIGSGTYERNGADRVITRHPLRSSNLNSGPYYVNGDEDAGPAGYYYPVYLTRSAAQSGVSFPDGPYTDISELTFVEFPGVTFYRPSEHAGYSATVGISGSNYNTLAAPVNFDTGVKEVFVTYPGKSSVFTGYGLHSDTNEPKNSGLAFWRNEQILNYSNQIVWDDTNNRLGVVQPAPQYALDIGGDLSRSTLNVSGIIEGGSGIMFSGGQPTYTGDTASGGKQLEPFLRTEVGQGANGLIELSGIVDQYIGISKQTPGTVYSGPETDHCGTPPCSSDYPTFRLLNINDIPLAALTTSGNFVLQNNLGLDSQSANISPDTYVFGMVPIYAGSGSITYDSGILYDYNNNRLLVGGDASTDTASYTVDARGTIGSQSGYLNQLIFTDGLIRIGTDAGTDDGNLTENYHLIGLGHSAGKGVSGIFDGLYAGRFAGLNSETASGVVIVGVRAGQSSTNLTESVGIGTSALRDADVILSGVVLGQTAAQTMVSGTNIVVIGPRAMMSATEVSEVVAIGSSAAKDASGIYNSVLVGNFAALAADELASGVAIGFGAASGSVGTDNVVAIGHQAAASINDASDVIALGSQAAMNASGAKDAINIGREAGALSSGEKHIFIGQGAGYATSGDGNIEITNNGTLITGATDNKLNIGGVVAGDTATGKLSIGSPSGLSPLATLTVEPVSADDIPFVIREVGSGHPQAMVVQSGDGTTFYHVTNSGDIITSGCVNPSGGLLLESITPANWMNSTTNRLYNDGGTLKFNGNTIETGSGSSWNLTNGLTVPDEITNAQDVMISGVSGIVIEYETTTNRMIISASGLSGVLQPQITASNYKFHIVASGNQTGNNDPKQMDTNDYLVMSGINGIEIDYIDQDDGTNHSGIFEISYNPSSAYSWFATNGDVANDEILDANVITVSGVSGVRVEYDSSTNFFRIGASGLSGVLQGGIDANLVHLSNENGPISVSGTSGVAIWASGEFGRLGLGSTPGTSGLILQDSSYIMDSFGSGNIKALSFPENGGRIIVRADAALTTSDQGGVGSILIGSGVGVGANQASGVGVIAIGPGAFGASGNNVGGRDGMVIIGRDAFSKEPYGDTTNSIAIGYLALSYGSGINNVAIGNQAGEQYATEPRDLTGSVDIGYRAGWRQAFGSDSILPSYGASAPINIGYRAGQYCASGYGNISIGKDAGSSQTPYLSVGNTRCVRLGIEAGYTTKECRTSINVGYRAGHFASGLHRNIFMGFEAGEHCSGVSIGEVKSSAIAIGDEAMGYSSPQSTVAIGLRAGYWASGIGGPRTSTSSVLIGSYAGYSRNNNASIIISTDQSLSSTTPGSGYDCDWSAQTDTDVLDIGHSIQGFMDSKNFHIGAQLNNTYRTSSEITSAVINVTPESTSDSDLILFQHSTNGTSTSQAAGLMKAQTQDAGTIQAVLNELVDVNGFMRLPRGTGTTGTYPNVVLWANGDKVIPGPGVVAIYEFGPSDKGIAVAHNDAGTYVWYKLPVSTLMS